MRLTAWLLVLALSGCGSSSSASSGSGTTPRATVTESDVGNRPFAGRCTATYEAENDITLVVLPVSDDFMLGFVLPGDGWEGECPVGSPQLAIATNEAVERMATVSVDTTVIGPVDVEAYANAQSAGALEALREQGIEAEGAPAQMMGGNIYVLTFRIEDQPGQFLLQFNAYHVVPTHNGLLRYHISQTSRDPSALNAAAPTLLNAVRAFGGAQAGD